MRLRIVWAWLCWRVDGALTLTNRWRIIPMARGEWLRRAGVHLFGLTPTPEETPREFRKRCRASMGYIERGRDSAREAGEETK